jgi:ribosomal protein S18 acetylase RimI-like enzyme
VRSFAALTLRRKEFSVPVEVRQATIQDIDAVLPLFDAYRQFYGKPSDLAGGLAFLRERFVNRDSVILLAQAGTGSAAGFIQLYPSFSSMRMARTWILNDLFVMPDARRGGVGRALMDEAVHFGRRMGAARLILSTARTNEPAQRLYESMGWKRDEMFYEYALSL